MMKKKTWNAGCMILISLMICTILSIRIEKWMQIPVEIATISQTEEEKLNSTIRIPKSCYNTDTNMIFYLAEQEGVFGTKFLAFSKAVDPLSITADSILLPEEKDYDEQALIEDILENKKRGKKNYIIINAEGIGDSINMAKRIEEATGIETRATILGHMQRGGSPTCKDRVYASTMGALAVDLLCEGKSNRVIGYQDGKYVDFDIDQALSMKKTIPEYQYKIAKSFAI